MLASDLGQHCTLIIMIGRSLQLCMFGELDMIYSYILKRQESHKRQSA
jgi:hypothetical protein